MVIEREGQTEGTRKREGESKKRANERDTDTKRLRVDFYTSRGFPGLLGPERVKSTRPAESADQSYGRPPLTIVTSACIKEKKTQH